MKLTISVDTVGVARKLDLANKQVRFATAVALTRTAKQVEASLQAEIRSDIDRPTPFTLRSTYTQPATKAKLEAIVWFKNRAAFKNRKTSSDILGHHFSGGTRQHKALEEWLARAGYIGSSEFVAPGEGAKLDQYGNLSRGQITQILSQLRAGPDASSYASSSRRSKAKRTKAGTMFWSRGGRLPRGVWLRGGALATGTVKPILVVIGRPEYGQLFDLPELARRVMQARFDAEFQVALRAALATAR